MLQLIWRMAWFCFGFVTFKVWFIIAMAHHQPKWTRPICHSSRSWPRPLNLWLLIKRIHMQLWLDCANLHGVLTVNFITFWYANTQNRITNHWIQTSAMWLYSLMHARMGKFHSKHGKKPRAIFYFSSATLRHVIFQDGVHLELIVSIFFTQILCQIRAEYWF